MSDDDVVSTGDNEFHPFLERARLHGYAMGRATAESKAEIAIRAHESYRDLVARNLDPSMSPAQRELLRAAHSKGVIQGFGAGSTIVECLVIAAGALGTAAGKAAFEGDSTTSFRVQEAFRSLENKVARGADGGRQVESVEMRKAYQEAYDVANPGQQQP